MDIVKEVLLPNINLEGIITQVLDGVLVPAIDKACASNPTLQAMEKVIVAALEPELKKAIADEIAKLKA